MLLMQTLMLPINMFLCPYGLKLHVWEQKSLTAFNLLQQGVWKVLLLT